MDELNKAIGKLAKMWGISKSRMIEIRDAARIMDSHHAADTMTDVIAMMDSAVGATHDAAGTAISERFELDQEQSANVIKSDMCVAETIRRVAKSIIRASGTCGCYALKPVSER